MGPYNFVLVSTIKWSKSAIWISPFSQTSLSPSPIPPIYVIAECWTEFLEMYRRFSVVICFTHGSVYMRFPSDSDGKESARNAGDPGSIPGSGRSLGEQNGYTTHYSILAWRIPWTEETVELQSILIFQFIPPHVHSLLLCFYSEVDLYQK